MISDELKAIVDKLKEHDNMILPDGATEDQITAYEKEYGTTLPTKYKEWLLTIDGGELYLPGGIQLYGVAHKPIIDVDDKDRPNDNYIVIGTLAMGDPILCEKTGEQISIYNHEAGVIESDESYPDFFAFLNSLNGILGIGG